MPESNKSTIVIASVLKPVDDSRMYEKIGLSLADTGIYQVHVIGCDSRENNHRDIVQHPHKPFRRLSPGRLFAPWRILARTMRLKPDILIITTHELLYLALFVKMISKCRIIYDVQENYYWNILYTSAFPLLIKPFAAFYVRGKEILTAHFIDHYFLAEKGYQQEMQFPKNKSTVLENKARQPTPPLEIRDHAGTKPTITLIFSGTLAETTGVFTAIDLAVKLHVIDERFRLTIIGHCAQTHVLEKIRLLTKPRTFITLIARDSPVPHTEILRAIAQADFGLITYQINPSTMNSIPTKLYEYLAFKLPVLLVNHKPWVEFCMPYNAAVIFDTRHFDAAEIYQEMFHKTFYSAEPRAVYWETEEPKLLAVVKQLAGGSRKSEVTAVR